MSSKLRSIGDLTATYMSPGDFTATYTSTTTITLSNVSGFTITDSSQIKYILQIKTDNTSYIYRNGMYGVTFTYSSGVITIYGAGTPFASGDVYQVGIVGVPYEKDYSIGALKVANLYNIWDRYIESQELVAASNVGADSDTWLDQGSEIECAGYKTLGLYVNYTRGRSTGSQLQILSKHTADDADEYVLETTADYQKTFGDADIKVAYFFDTTAIPFVQIQTKATYISSSGVTGSIGTVTIDYVLEY